MTRTRPPRPWEVWWIRLDTNPVGHEQGYIRPAMIVNSPLYVAGRQGMSIAVPLTTRDRGLPWQPQLSLTAPDGKTSVAMVDQIRALSHDRLLRQESQTLTEGDVKKVRFVLRQLIDLGK